MYQTINELVSESSLGLSAWCTLFGKTRQAYYKHQKRREAQQMSNLALLADVLLIRRDHKLMGTNKIRVILKDHPGMMGRDRFFDLMATHGLLVRKRKSRVYTTNSNHRFRKYGNLIKELEIDRKNQVWVSDITYVKVGETPYYLSLITDAYSNKIVGHCIAKSLEAKHSLSALKYALKVEGNPEIHHSDRGIQYCCDEYTSALKQENRAIQISMSKKGDPLENPIAERVNGIIKNEYLCNYNLDKNNYKEQVATAIRLYNLERPHYSQNMKTPSEIHDGIINPLTTFFRNKNQSLTLTRN
ncbi:IS3 family transposase [Luteibaculum oceani]|uniref:IS3 family transposase n=1 Tax=Luteibaculum oceani TaxID=1294296 RepID=UPI00147718C1|nr:IS3 family transposase [Luteibaculum oceani]